jgi:hypothetical protein
VPHKCDPSSSALRLYLIHHERPPPVFNPFGFLHSLASILFLHYYRGALPHAFLVSLSLSLADVVLMSFALLSLFVPDEGDRAKGKKRGSLMFNEIIFAHSLLCSFVQLLLLLPSPRYYDALIYPQKTVWVRKRERESFCERYNYLLCVKNAERM